MADAALLQANCLGLYRHSRVYAGLNVGASTFNAGIRVFDTTNPFQPQEVAYYIPSIPEGANANGIMYVVDQLVRRYG